MIWKGLPRFGWNYTGTITRETKLNGTAAVTNAYGSTYSPAELWNGNITIKGRGNSTWGLPKKPYAIVTANGSFAKQNTTLFGWPSDSDYVLLATYWDKPMVRTLLASDFSYALGLPWCTRCQLVEGYDNGAYAGLYTACEKVKKATGRANISSSDIICEFTALDQIADADARFQDSIRTDRYWTPKIPDPDSTSGATLLTGFQTAYQDFLYRLYNVSFSDLTNGYRAVIDAPSFAKYFLLQDLIMNNDAFNSSWYLGLVGGRLTHGPAWDFDVSLATWLNNPFSGYDDAEANFTDPNNTFLRQRCPYYDKLMTDPYFSGLVSDTFKAALPALHAAIASMQSFVPQLVATGAIERNRTAWPDILSDTNFIVTADYNADYNRLLNFIKARLYYHTRKLYDIVPKKPATVKTT